MQNPTRIEVVTALIYKNVMALTKGNSSSSIPSILIQTVNMRPRISPPLPKNSIGNFSWFHTILSKDESEKNLIAIVGGLRKGIEQLCNKYATNKTANQCYSLLCDSIKERKSTAQIWWYDGILEADSYFFYTKINIYICW